MSSAQNVEKDIETDDKDTSDLFRMKTKDDAFDTNVELQPIQTKATGEVIDVKDGESLAPKSTYDAVWGEITEGGAQYNSVGWIGAAGLMMKSQIGLGVLTIPLTFASLGLVPGVLCIIGVAIVTTWSDYIVGVFKINHPDVYCIDDVGEIIAGPIGRWVAFAFYIVYWIFVSGSAMLSISIALNVFSDHGACTLAFVGVAAIAAFLLASIETMHRMTPIAYAGLLCILSAIFTLTIAVALQNRPASAPQTGPWSSNYKVVVSADFVDGMNSLSSIIFAYSGTPSFFNIVSEMKEPRHYTRSLLLAQTVVTVVYLIIGIIVYYYCGSFVASPALGTAGPLLKKVCYGLALPGLLATLMIVTHVPSKLIFVTLMRDSKHVAKHTWQHWTVWLSCTLGITIIAFIIAGAIPNFGSLVSLIGAALGTAMSLQPMGAMWLYDNWSRPKEQRDWKWKFMCIWSAFVIAFGFYAMIAGTYAAAVQVAQVAKSGFGKPYSCADNST